MQAQGEPDILAGQLLAGTQLVAVGSGIYPSLQVQVVVVVSAELAGQAATPPKTTFTAIEL